MLRSALTKLTLPPALPAAFNEFKVPASETFSHLNRLIYLKAAVTAKLSKDDYVKIKDIPLQLQQAIIAVEDSRFYTHSGFDWEGILRATLVNMQTGSVVEGASTITQQLVKNLFLSHERTMGRKAEEFILALDMEMHYSKEEILEMYLNTIYFGSGAYGVNQAAKIYFDRPLLNLNFAECTMLAGLPNAPSLYSPYVDFNAAKQRQAVVVGAMIRQGLIGPGLAEEVKSATIKLAK